MADRYAWPNGNEHWELTKEEAETALHALQAMSYDQPLADMAMTSIEQLVEDAAELRAKLVRKLDV